MSPKTSGFSRGPEQREWWDVQEPAPNSKQVGSKVAFQASAYSVLTAYLDDPIISDVQNGPLMTTLSLIVWYLSVSVEAGKIYAFCSGVCSIPRGATVVTVKFVSVSLLRVTLVLLLQICRAGVAVGLLYAGTW